MIRANSYRYLGRTEASQKLPRGKTRWKVLAAGVGACLLLPLITTPAEAQNSNLNSVTSVTPSTPPGCTRILPSSTTMNADGSTTYRFHYEAATITQVLPPKGFDVATATSSALARYQVPVLSSQERTQLHGPLRVTIGLSACPHVTAGYVGSIQSDNWSGILTPPNTANYDGANGEFNQTGFRSCPNENSGESSWIGIGGWLGGPLLQTGTVTPNPSSTATNEFVEWIGKNGADSGALTGAAVAPGDPVVSQVAWNPGPSNGNGTFTYTTVDLISDQYDSASVSLPENNYDPASGPSGATAEAVDERPIWNPSHEYEALKPFYSGTVYWDNFSMGPTSNPRQDPYSSVPFDTLYMTSTANTSQRLANPTSYGSGSITDTWIQCGVWQPVQ